MNTTGPERISDNPSPDNTPDDGELMPSTGEHPGDGVLDILRHAVQRFIPHASNPVSSEERPKIDTASFMDEFRRATHFYELDEDLVVTEDPVGLKRILPDETEETYMQKMAQERKKGKNEAVSYGSGIIGKNRFVEVVFNWEFMAGSSGVVAGEKFIRASHLAQQENLPMIVMCASGGQRQQEGVAALREMKRTVYALDQFKKNTDQPLIFVLVGNVWGGLTASGVPLADLTIGMAGTDFGFAGKGPIKAYVGEEPPKGSQTVEKSFETNRGVHIILNNQDELLYYLGRKLDIIRLANQPPEKPKRVREVSGIYFGYPGFHVPFRPDRLLRSHPRTAVPMVFNPIKPKTVWEQHKVLSGDLRRPDTLYILQHAFDSFVPLFSGKVSEQEDNTHLRYPPIIAALAYIDDPRLQKRLMRMIIGNQLSYLKLPDEKVMIDHKNSNPTAWDYQYELSAIEYARRLKYPITTFVHTFGARPTLEDELAAQYRGIALCLQAQLDYPFFTSSYLIGIGGSGGHLALDFTTDYAAMLGSPTDFPEGGAQEFVAEPRSAAAILYPRGLSEVDIIRTAEGMRPTAEFLEARGLVDRIVKEPKGGAENRPLATALALREDVIQAELAFGHLTPEQILTRRMQRIESSQPIPIGHLSGRKTEDNQSRLTQFRKLFHR